MENFNYKTLAKVLKISTWVCITGVIFLFFVSIRVSGATLPQTYTFYSIIVLIVGYLCNAVTKWIVKNKLNNE